MISSDAGWFELLLVLLIIKTESIFKSYHNSLGVWGIQHFNKSHVVMSCISCSCYIIKASHCSASWTLLMWKNSNMVSVRNNVLLTIINLHVSMKNLLSLLTDETATDSNSDRGDGAAQLRVTFQCEPPYIWPTFMSLPTYCMDILSKTHCCFSHMYFNFLRFLKIIKCSL